MSTPAAPPTGSGALRARASRPLIALAAVTVALAAAGLVVTANTLFAKSSSRPFVEAPSSQAESTTFVADQAIPTSFGTLYVYPLEQLPGLTSEQLGGVTHGVQNLVGSANAQIEVAIALTNKTGNPMTYTPGQFLLRTELGGPGVPPTTSSTGNGRLQPGASVTANLSFVVPQDGSRYWLEFVDSARAPAIAVDLGRTEPAPAGSQEQPHH